MTSATGKLEKDLHILVAMASEMEIYLTSDVLFWRMSKSRMPALTLGGYLMRQHRLLLLQDLLSPAEQVDLSSAVSQYNNSLIEKIVRFEQKAHRELDARLRQWGEYLKDVDRGTAATTSNYSTAVEVRTMISSIINQLQLAPYSLNPHVQQQVSLLDKRLRRSWEPGDLVWPEAWQPAYPNVEYWWLYGKPKYKPRP
ncbi:MAG: hypothetical protein JSV68_23985 [Anaerolineaceae bacterium]|nr:MAG: hypothetical protein JSV68_23985 [Anaerolineaceae bacterium]